ncbi:MAG: UDP-N-acetylglucosamine 1-carboxyvinyltransferase [Eubacteriaceae bacterium]|nr:UDP-N-acetylglucosamine 1-carboxyvinyltransferase [Eubacteriaceae bacterium]
MQKYVINGGRKLEGIIDVQGSKNASLPILAASILNGGINIIHDIPSIADVAIMLDILKGLGCNVVTEGKTVSIDSSTINNTHVSDELVSLMRSSFILLGALLSKNEEVIFSYPGGCTIGRRPIDIHLKALREMGAEISELCGYIICKASKLKGADISLDFPSVGATENIILAAVKAQGQTVIRNAAKEPEIVDLQGYLNSIGAVVSGAGTDTIYIEGVSALHDTQYHIMKDRIVAGTYIAACNMTGGDVLLKGINKEMLGAIYPVMASAGAILKSDDSGVRVKSNAKVLPIGRITTMPYPGFPTDMQPQITTMLSIADGVSVVKETIFENRFRYIAQLQKMGTDIITEGNSVLIKGVKRLHGAKVYAEDLRAGAALIMAALKANERSEVYGINFVKRGYDNIEGVLAQVGADITLSD